MYYYLITNVGTYTESGIVARYRRHLVLAQLWDEKGYASRTRSLARKGATIMLDNGAHEAVVIDLNRYARIVKESHAHYVVLPDLIGQSSEASCHHGMGFYGSHPELFSSSPHGCLPVYAVQGTSKADVLNGYKWAMETWHPAHVVLAIGQAYLQFLTEEEQNEPNQLYHESARLRLLMSLQDMNGFSRFRWHILGARWSPTKVFGSVPQIIGIDTIKPCICALTTMMPSSPNLYPNRPHRTVFSRRSTTVAWPASLVDNIYSFSVAYSARLDYVAPK